MIAEDFGLVRVLVTESIAGTTVEVARARAGPKDRRGTPARKAQAGAASPVCKCRHLCTPTQATVFEALCCSHKRPGEICGLGVSSSEERRGNVRRGKAL